MRLRTARSTIAHRQATLNAAMDQLANAQRAIEVWAQQNPTCPVCNGVIDASALLSSRGEHAHV
jgi:formamidopyrimidine-DNA glycosylase